MANTKNLSTKNLKLRVLVSGSPKSGKTTFAATFPHPHIEDFDGGVLSIRGKDVEYVSYDAEDMTKPWAFRKSMQTIQRLISEPKGIETLVLDSFTTWFESMLRAVQVTTGTAGSPPEIKDWNIATMKVKKLLDTLKFSGLNVVAVFHELTEKDEITNQIVSRPYVFGKRIPPILSGWFDECYATKVQRDSDGFRYVLQTVQDRRREWIGSRLGCLDEFEVPDFKVIMEKVRKGEKDVK